MIDTSLIPSSDYIETLEHEDGDTEDIIQAVLKADAEHDDMFCAFSSQFSRDDAGLKQLWKFVKYQIKYKEDPFGKQNIKAPAALWKAKKGDCKSKTLFVNQVLRCLNIEYLTRFVGYDGMSYKHVYTVAFLRGRAIVIDTVYDYFDAEPQHNLEKDYEMTRIAIIRGMEQSSKEAALQTLSQAALDQGHKAYVEIQQKKQYVQPEENLNFGMMTTKEALTELLIRKLKILGVMQEKGTLAEQGINLVRQSIRTGKMPTGIIPDELQGVMKRLNGYLSMDNTSAVGHGTRGKLLNYYKVKALNGSIGSIGAAQSRCLLKDFYKPQTMLVNNIPQVIGTGTPSDPFLYNVHPDNLYYYNDSICNPTYLQDMRTSGDANRNTVPSGVNFPLSQWQSIWDASQSYYYYGRTLEAYRLRFNTQVDNDLYNIMNGLIQQYPSLISEVGNRAYHFNNEASYDLAQEELNQRLGVLSNWANDLYRADNTRPNGTVGTGLLYTFIPETTQAIGAISPANFPTSVQTKMVFQQQYMASCVDFSSIAPIVIKDMAENGILYDNGGESPERILAALVQTYDPSISCPPCAIIVPIVLAVISALPAIIEAVNKGSQDSRLIDESASDTAQFRTQSTATLFSELDFLRTSNNNGGGNGGGGGNGTGGGGNGGNNTGGGGSKLPFIILGAGALYAASKSKEKSKSKKS